MLPQDLQKIFEDPAEAISFQLNHRELHALFNHKMFQKKVEKLILIGTTYKRSDKERSLVPFGGIGGLFMIEELRRGSQGTMPVCAFPEIFVKAFNLWDKGEELKAEEYFYKYIPLIRNLGQGLGIWNWLPKYILKRKKVFSEVYAREPSLKPDNQQIEELYRLMDILEL